MARSPRSAPVHAQANWPQKPIQLIVPFPAGGGTDIIARSVANRLAPRLGQPIVIDNRPGASGVIGTQAVAKAPPDGYTLVLGVTNTHAVNPTFFKSLPYDAQKDFQPVSLLAVGPHVLVVNANTPAKTLPELVALIKSQPGKHTFASYGNGSTAHLLGEMMREADKLEYTHVPYKGIPPALQDLLGERVTLLYSTTAAALPHIKSGKLRALAITSEKRLDLLPDVPTMNELGRPDATLNHWYGVLAPAGTPMAIVDKLAREIAAVLQLPEIRETHEQAGVAPTSSTPEQFAAFISERDPALGSAGPPLRHQRGVKGVLSLAGRNVLVTGAAGAIGRETARLFQALGASLFLTDRDPEALAAFADELAASGNVGFLHGDVTDPAQVGAIRARFARQFERADALVLAAGIYRPARVADMTDEEWSTMLGVNLDGTFFFCREFVPLLAEDSAIVMLSSIAVRGSARSATTQRARAPSSA